MAACRGDRLNRASREPGETLRRAWLSNGSLIILAGRRVCSWPMRPSSSSQLNGDFAFDFTCCYQQAGQRLLDDPSGLYAWTDTYTFRYSPWAAVLFAPMASLSETAAVWLWLALKVVVLVVVAVGLGRRWSGDARWLVAGMVLFFPPIWHDLALGNVSVFTVAVLAVLLARRDGVGGVAFGLLLLLAPKPHLLPLALWLAVRRPRDAVAALATLGIGVVAGVLVFGPDLWLDWLGTFREPLERTFTANIGFSGLLGPPGVVVGVIAAVVIGAAALVRRDRHRSGPVTRFGDRAGALFLHPLPVGPGGGRRPRAPRPAPLAGALPVAADRVPAHSGVAAGAGVDDVADAGCRGRRGGSGAASSSARLTRRTRGRATSWATVASSHPYRVSA